MQRTGDYTFLREEEISPHSFTEEPRQLTVGGGESLTGEVTGKVVGSPETRQKRKKFTSTTSKGRRDQLSLHYPWESLLPPKDGEKESRKIMATIKRKVYRIDYWGKVPFFQGNLSQKGET